MLFKRRSPKQFRERGCRREEVTSIDDTCTNNNQTTWTYNQGVILSGLALLYNATHNSTLISIAQKIADATIQRLTYSNGILKEPCEPTCDDDQKLFKGIFVRHLAYLLFYLTDTFHIQKYTTFLQQNAVSVWTMNRCELDGLFGLVWNNDSCNSCESSRDSATTSAGLDLFIAVASIKQQAAVSSNWKLLGQGNCIDDQNFTMPNFYRNEVNETVCRMTASADSGAIAYDYQLNCVGIGFCRIRTLSSRSQTPSGWTYENGIAHNVTRTDKMVLTNCFLRTNST
ncbi:unnamed protein product [Didymodactylos carnosus]|uniref:Uncharacterized protein n=1 Tax=Didymodactylos carnosus TaxID=1234261 RepID=A0A815TM57_9BILA|nr:unnamed protein product [Didymodactylos carnosus]CAF1534510.1 unnamed protein product [Didymodactylos carnosus]CAF4321863.1 unnamed protein product [Didymodactylos carnosus]CAF4365305.1 unnamed protein product [Didymodactylos carnosus]